MNPEREQERRKSPYEKPRLTTIELAVDEVLGTGCKLDYSGWASGGYPCINTETCQLVGS